MMAIEPQKSWIATVLLCQLLGTLVVHRFYTGRLSLASYNFLPLGLWHLGLLT